MGRTSFSGTFHRVEIPMTEQEWLTSEDPVAMLDWLLVMPGLSVGMPSDRKLLLFAVAISRLMNPEGYWGGRHREDACVHAYAEDLADGLKAQKGPYFAPYCRGLSALVEQDGAYAAREHASFSLGGHEVLACNLLRDIVGNPYRPVPLSDQWTAPMGTARYTHPWLTPTVIALAQNAYDERGTVCGWCKGKGGFLPYEPGLFNETCSDCHGTGRIDNGTLDPCRFAVLADALEEAGATEENAADLLWHLRGIVGCDRCEGAGTIEIFSGWEKCPSCKGEGLVPPNPHVRGCWALDLILGKE